MKLRFLSEQEVYHHLPMSECMEVMAETLKTLARGQGVNPLRTALRFPDGTGLLGLMPAYLAEPPCTGLKVVTVMPGNHGTPYDSHQGLVLLFELEHGCPVALVEGSSVTAVRTAAVSGVATERLARSDASTLAILGSGVQARTHLQAMLVARNLTEVRVWSRTEAHARAFAEAQSQAHGLEIRVAGSAREAVEGADLICTTTSAKEPVLEGAWLSPGAHINAVGACFAPYRELDTAAVVAARLFVDRRESALNEAGDFLIPKKEGAIGDDHIVGELGEVLLGQVEGRRSERDITLFKSLGIGVEDLGAAYYLYRKAEQENLGRLIEWGGPAR